MADENTTPDETTDDSANRGLRTLFQGALASVLTAVAAVIADTVVPGVAVHWPTLGLLAGSAALTALAAYVQKKVGK